MSAAEERLESLRMIRESAAAIAPQGGDLKRIRAQRFTDPGFDRAVWREMCELGWTGLRVSEDRGGSALGVSEFCALLEELGAGLVPEPLIATSMAAQLLLDPVSVIDGSRIVLPAWQERANTLDATECSATITGGKLTGGKMFVPFAGGADAFLVSARLDGKIALALVDAKNAVIQIERTQDGGTFGTLTFENAPCEVVVQDAASALDAALDEAALATAAYMLGVMDRSFQITLEYLKTRQQFGKAIGSFQALQHRATDLSIQIALTRASLESAAASLDAGAKADARKAAVSRAKARATDAGMLVTRQAIQLHGGIGYTDEADVGLYTRKAMVLSNQYGAATLHRRRFMATAVEED